MKRKILVSSIVVVILLAGAYFVLSQNKKKMTVKPTYKVTFIELGSVRCIPCRKMEPVLESLRKKYPEDVKVLFYDVWTKEGKPYGEKYGIQSIPTQVFLGEDGKEYFRHVGYFPEEEVIKILKKKKVEK